MRARIDALHEPAADSLLRYDPPLVKGGRLVRARKADLDAFINRRTVSAEAQ